MSEPEAKTVEQLLDMGGKFYEMGGESYCDTPLDVWRLDPAAGGYVRVPETEGAE